MPTEKENVQKSHADTLSSTVRFLPIAEIHDDIVVLKDGSIRAVLDVTSINFSLKSEAEQDAIIYSYQNFLNSLEHPVQILIRSKKLDLDEYLAKLKEIEMKQENPLLRNQTVQYIQFITRLIDYADIMQKNFYVIVPYDQLMGDTKKKALASFMDSINPDDSISRYRSRLKEFASLKKGLLQRVSLIQAGLENCGLKTTIVPTEQLIQLFYESYNPITAMYQKLKDPNINDTKRSPKEETKD